LASLLPTHPGRAEEAAEEGGAFDLKRTPAIQDWLKRVAAQDKHIAITD